MKNTPKTLCVALAFALAALTSSRVTAQNIGQVDFVAMFGHDGNVGPTINLFNNAVTVSARTMIDASQPFVLGAMGSTGTIYVDYDADPYRGGLGVQTSELKGSTGISGGGGHQDEELVFTYNHGGAAVNSISLIVNTLSFGSDDPYLWLSTNHGIFGFNDTAIAQASTLNGPESYTINFGNFAGSVGGAGTIVDGFVIRETTGHTLVRGFSAGVVPEPGSALLAGLGLFAMVVRSRRRGLLSCAA